MEQTQLLNVLSQLARGDLTVDVAARLVRSILQPRTGPQSATATTGGTQSSAVSTATGTSHTPTTSHTGSLGIAHTSSAQLDLDRRSRCGFSEVVYAPGKTVADLIEIFHALQRQGHDCFATRVSQEQATGVLEVFPNTRHNPVARTLRLDNAQRSAPAGKVVVITAGTGDRPVAEEAVETARWMGCQTDLIFDVGVAGPQRLPAQKHRFEHADVVVVVAGMEAALPSVVGGYVSCPVIAVPTSVGYGAHFQGLAALLGMVNSCAANVSVVNIDAGFKGGYVAALIARKLAEHRS